MDGNVVAERSHGDAEVAFRQGGRIVEAVADDHDPLSGGAEGADVIDLVLR